MKPTKFATLLFVLSIVFNCSSSDGDENPDTSNPAVVEKDLIKITGDADHWLNYENGTINKAWSSITTYRSQMLYNSDGTMSKEFREFTGNPNSDNENFGWEIPVSENFIENIYENEKLVEVVRHYSGDSWKLVDYTYQGDLVVEKRRYTYDDNPEKLDRIFTYIYNSQNEITTMIVNETPAGGSTYTLQVTFDDKVNPYFKIWDETKLTFWMEFWGDNLEFYPHNVLKLQEEGESDVNYEAFYTYDADNYPIIMNITEGNSAGDNYSFEYQ